LNQAIVLSLADSTEGLAPLGHPHPSLALHQAPGQVLGT
jgi:hypothetical protein